MQKIEDYRKHAGDCREMAARAPDENQRDMLLSMALTWDSLADARQEQHRRKERLKLLDAEVSDQG